MAEVGELIFNEVLGVSPLTLTTVFTYTSTLGDIFVTEIGGTSNATSDWIVRKNGDLLKKKNTAANLNPEMRFDAYRVGQGETITVEVINCDDFDADYTVDMRFLR